MVSKASDGCKSHLTGRGTALGRRLPSRLSVLRYTRPPEAARTTQALQTRRRAARAHSVPRGPLNLHGLCSFRLRLPWRLPLTKPLSLGTAALWGQKSALFSGLCLALLPCVDKSEGANISVSARCYPRGRRRLSPEQSSA